MGGFFGMSAAMVASLAVSAVLIVLLVPLSITSLNSVKSRMQPAAWKKLQKLSYLFYGLAYAHILLMLVPTISTVGQRAMLSLVVYTLLFGVYAVMRCTKGLRDGRARDADPQTASGAAA